MLITELYTVAGILEVWGDLVVNNSLILNITGTVIVHGNIVMANGGSLSVSGAGSLQVGGSISGGNNSTITTAGGGTIAVSGSITLGGGGSSISGPTGSISVGSGCTISGTPCSSSALPIVLANFSVLLQEHAVLITWATEKEDNFDYFEIERAGNDFGFETIKSVKGAGYNTNTLTEYSIYDESPLIGVNYYRLKAIDVDGSHEYFKPKSVINNSDRKIRIAHNPIVGNVIKYNMNFEPKANDRVVLVDLNGAELMSSVVLGINNELVVDKSLNPGAYLLRYVSTSFQEVARVVVNN